VAVHHPVKWQHRFSIECSQAASACRSIRLQIENGCGAAFIAITENVNKLRIDTGELFIEIAKKRSLLGRFSGR
jgi:hypothetical protein